MIRSLFAVAGLILALTAAFADEKKQAPRPDKDVKLSADEKALVERMKGKPFALLGINSDGSREKVKEILEKNGITWRNAVDGDTEGPLATKWKVRAWPTTYVLDEKGAIRSLSLEDAEELVKKLEGKKSKE